MTSVVRQGHGIVLGLILVDPVWGSWGSSGPLQYCKNRQGKDKAYVVIYKYTLCLYVLHSTSVYTQAPTYKAYVPVHYTQPYKNMKTRHRLSYTSIHYVDTSYKALLYIHRPLPIRPMYTTQPYTRDMKRGGASGGWSSHPPVIRTKPTG